MTKKINPYDEVVWKNTLRKNKSGGGLYIQEIEKTGRGLVRPLSLEEVKPNEWYLLRPNGIGQNYRPVHLSEHADYRDIKTFIRKGMLYVKTY